MRSTFTNSDGSCKKCGAAGLFDDAQKKEHLVLNPQCSNHFKIWVRRVIDEKPNGGESFIERLRRIAGDAQARRESPKPHLISEISKHLMEKDAYFTFDDTGEVIFYDESVGHYVFGGENKIRKDAQDIIDEAQLRTHCSNGVVNEVVGFIQRGTFVRREHFEEEVEWVNLGNGVLNIKTREFHPHDPNFHFLTKLAVKYDPAATCPGIDKFISEVMRPEDVPIIYELGGYLLMRGYPFQHAFMLNGSGSNGKSTLINLLIKYLGTNNVSNVPVQDFAENRFASASLYNKYANMFADVSSNALKDTGQFKTLTGGDTIYIEKKYKDMFPFVNYAKLIFSCNTLPFTFDDSDAFFRRWIVLDFERQFTGKSDNKNLGKEITTDTELSGFLNASLAALTRLEAAQCFSNDKSIEEKRVIYKMKSDSLMAWSITEIETSLEAITPKADLWGSYLRFCGQRKILSLTETKFWLNMKRMFMIEDLRQRVDGKLVASVKGICFKQPPATDMPKEGQNTLV